MALIWGVVVVVAASAVMVGAMLWVRRGAPEGSRFVDGDRAAGVFGVLATGFALLLGFVVFLAFTTYDDSRAGAEAEAMAVIQQFETAQLLPVHVREPLSGQLVCYARSVVGQEWPELRDGAAPDPVNPWGLALFQTIRTSEPRAASEQSAYDAWLSLTNDREQARMDRLHAAEGMVPTPVWIVLFLSAGLVFVFVLFFADSGEPRVVQALMAGSVAAIVVSILLLLGALERPYRSFGGLEPTAMERTLAILDEARDALGVDDPVPCNEVGEPT